MSSRYYSTDYHIRKVLLTNKIVKLTIDILECTTLSSLKSYACMSYGTLAFNSTSARSTDDSLGKRTSRS